MAEARINKEYLLRTSGVALFMVAICIWFIYDGFAAWPQKNREYEKVRPALLATNLSARAWLARTGENGQTPLDRIFAERNLETPKRLIRRIDEAKMPENPAPKQSDAFRERERKILRGLFEAPIYSAGDLKGQFVTAAISALIAICVFLTILPKIKRFYVADETGLHGKGFGRGLIKYEEIKSIDWKLWEKKGIVKLILEEEGEIYTLDCWHFKGMKAVVETITEHRPDLAPEA